MARALVLVALLLGTAVVATAAGDGQLSLRSGCTNNTCTECSTDNGNYTPNGECIQDTEKKTSYTATCTASEYNVTTFSTVDCGGKGTAYVGKVGCSSEYTLGKLVVEKRKNSEGKPVDAVILKFCGTSASEECPTECEEGEHVLYPLDNNTCYFYTKSDGSIAYTYKGTFTNATNFSVAYYGTAKNCEEYLPLFTVEEKPSGTCATITATHQQATCIQPTTTGAYACSFSVFLFTLGAVLVFLVA